MLHGVSNRPFFSNWKHLQKKVKAPREVVTHKFGIGLVTLTPSLSMTPLHLYCTRQTFAFPLGRSHLLDQTSKTLKIGLLPYWRALQTDTVHQSPLALYAHWQHVLVMFCPIFERFLEILLEFSRCLNFLLLWWIWIWDPFVWGSSLSSLTSSSYPFTLIKRAYIYLGRGSPSCILDSAMHIWGLILDCRTFNHSEPS